MYGHDHDSSQHFSSLPPVDLNLYRHQNACACIIDNNIIIINSSNMFIIHTGSYADLRTH